MLSPCFFVIHSAHCIYSENRIDSDVRIRQKPDVKKTEKEKGVTLKHLTIAVGIIRNPQHEIFITQRNAASHMAGFWEFPGGKVEAGETPEQALKRELGEETGIVPLAVQPLKIVEHTFDDRRVTLHFFLVEAWQGEPYGREGQPMRWVSQHALREEEFPPANAGIIALLKA